MATYQQVKGILQNAFGAFWTADVSRRYWAFSDPVYDLVTPAAWQALTSRAPAVDYVQHVYDCDDHAMQFKAYTSRTQVSDFPGVRQPFSIGLAMGRFSWAGEGAIDHVANFAILDDRSIEWFDLRSARTHPLSTIRSGLIWVLM
jgi:hypothetical protein